MSAENPLPQIDLFPRITALREAAGGFLAGVLRHLPEVGYPSDRPHGAAELLDAHLHGEIDPTDDDGLIYSD